jgi:hypothetical protein
MKKTLLIVCFTLISALSFGQTQPVVHNATFTKIAKNSGSDCACSGWINKSVGDQGESSTKSGDDVAKLDNLESDALYQEVAVEANSDYTLDLEYWYDSDPTTTDYIEIVILKGSAYVSGYTPAYAEPATAAQDGYGYETLAQVDETNNHVARTTIVPPGNTDKNDITQLTFNTGSETSIAIYIRAVGPYDASIHGDSGKDKGFMNGDAEVRVDNLVLTNLGAASTATNITVSIDVSADPGGVNIVTPSVSGSWAEYAATVDPNDANKYSYTFPDDVTSAEFVWKVYGTSAGDVQESLTGLVGGGAYENNIAAYLPTNNGINTDYSTYCNRTVSSSETYEAPTFIFNSFQQVGVTYTELTVTAPAGNNVVMDYSLNNWSEFHGPGAKDNGDGTHTAIVNADLAFEYKWNDLTAGTVEDLTACANGGGINTDNSTYANRVHTAGVNASDVFNTCPSTASVDDNNVLDAQVYPNPTTGLLTISSAEVISGVEVYNVIGKRVLQITTVVNNSVDVSSLSKGIYMLKIASGDSIATKKIIKN